MGGNVSLMSECINGESDLRSDLMFAQKAVVVLTILSNCMVMIVFPSSMSCSLISPLL